MVRLKNYFTTWKMALAENLAVSAVEWQKYFWSWCNIYGEKNPEKVEIYNNQIGCTTLDL